MTTIALSDSNELLFTNGKLALISGPEATAQKLRNLFLLVKGEWFLDTRVGVPYFDTALVKNPDLGVIKRLFRRVILSAQGVKEILSLDLGYNAAARTLTFTTRVLHDSGAVISGGSGEPFIVTGAP